MEAQLLEEIGLTKGEIAAYFALLELGSSTVGPIINKAKVSSSKVYNILKRLVDKGLVSYAIRENRKYFEAATPTRILDYLKEKEQKIQSQAKEVESILPRLLLKQELAEHKQEVNIYEGFKGVKTAHEKTLTELKKGDEFFFMGASLLSSEKLKNYWQDYHKRREKAGITTRILFNQDVSHREIENRNAFSGAFAKYMPMNLSTPSWIEVFKDTTIIGVPSENPISVEIKNKDVAQSFKSYFEALWSQKVMVYEGADAAKKFFTNILTDLKRGEEYYVLNTNVGYQKLPEIRDFFHEYHRKRREKGIHVNMLLNNNMRSYPEYLKLEEGRYRYLPPDFRSPLQMTFYKDKLYISLWESEPVGFLIQDRKVVSAIRAYYDLLWNTEVQTFSGGKGIELLYEQVLAEKSDLYLIGANANFMRAHPSLFSSWDRKRVKAGIRRHHLSIEKTRGMEFNRLPETKVRYLPEQFASPMVIWVFGNKVAHVLWNKLTVFLVDNRIIADDYLKYFRMLWKDARE